MTPAQPTPLRVSLLIISLHFLHLTVTQGQSPRLWSQMSNIERRNRIEQLKERLFFEIKDKGLGGGGGNYGAPDIPSYNNNNQQQQQPPSYNQQQPNFNQQPPSYNNQQPPSYGAKPSYGGKAKGGKIIEIPIPDLPIPDPIEFKAAVLRSKGRIASGLLHTKAGILRAGANILAQKANALDKFAQAIPAIKANIINTMKGSGKGGYGAPPPPSNTYGAPPPQPSYNRPSGGISLPVGPTQGPSYNSGTSGNLFNPGNILNSVLPNNNFNSNSNFNNNQNNNYNNNNFSPSNQDGYGSPQGDVITGTGIQSITSPRDVGNVQVSSSLSFGNGDSGNYNGNSFGNGDSFRNGNGFNPLIQSTLDQASQGKRNVLAPGQQTTLTINGLNNLRGNTGEKLVLQETRGAQGFGSCQSDFLLHDLLQDIFMGNEIIPDIIDHPPRYPLDLTYKTIRTFPGMRLTADMTRFKPMLKWPAQPDSLYTIVLSNLDINSRKNRTLSEFWHWFVANVPGDSVDDGQVIFDLLFPLVLPEGDGDHRYGYFVFEQPGQMDYREEGGPTDSCSPNMSNGRGPFKSTKNFMKKYNLDLAAATFLIIDSNEASMQIACEWQKCIGDTINLVSPLQCG